MEFTAAHPNRAPISAPERMEATFILMATLNFQAVRRGRIQFRPAIAAFLKALLR
jgi:hypothetical protein